MESIDEIKRKIIEEEQKAAAEETAPANAQLMPIEEQAPVAIEKNSAAQAVIDKQRERDLNAIAEDESFQKASHDVASRDVAAKLRAEALDVLSAEQRNALAEYTLKKEKERLDYRVRFEKKIDKEEIRAEVYARKVRNAEAMYGQYYKQEVVETLDQDGNVVKTVRYKNFTTSKFVNKIRVFANWYNNLAEGSRKVIWTTIKIVFFGGLTAGVIAILVRVFKWLVSSGILNNLAG